MNHIIYICIYIYHTYIIYIYTDKAKTEEPSAITERVAPRYNPLKVVPGFASSISQIGNVNGLETPRKTQHIYLMHSKYAKMSAQMKPCPDLCLFVNHYY